MRRMIPAVFALAWLAACAKEAPPPEVSNGPSRQDSLATAAEAFDSTAFDTVTWRAPEEALSRGGLVFRTSCNKCHGVTGNGDGDLVGKGKSPAPPNFLATDWKYTDDPMDLRRAIFVGGATTMPYWGLVGLKSRDLDSVARYITDYLRPTFGEPSGD